MNLKITNFNLNKETVMSSEKPKISIIIPSFNQGEYIEKTITSILDQEYSNIEIIVMDGGSNDSTVEVIKKYESKITHWQSKKDKGQTDAINNGHKKASGDIITWLCSDDYYEPNTLKTIASTFEQNPDVNLVCGNRRTYGLGIKDTLYIGWKTRKTLEETLFAGHYDQPPSFFRKEVWDSIFPLTTSLHVYMDCEMWLMYLLKYGMNKAIHVPQLMAHGLFHATSKSVNEAVPCRKVLNTLYLSIAESLETDPSNREKLRTLPQVEYNKNWNIEQKIDKALYDKLLMERFEPQIKDSSYIYRDVAEYFMFLGNPKAGMRNAWEGIKIEPFKLINYRTWFYCFRKQLTT